MALPGLDVVAIRSFCEQRVSLHALSEVRIEADVGPTAVTIVECRAPLREGDGAEWTRGSVARLRYVAKHGHWALHWPDSDGKWNKYDPVGPSSVIRVLLDEIDQDRHGIFWG